THAATGPRDGTAITGMYARMPTKLRRLAPLAGIRGIGLPTTPVVNEITAIRQRHRDVKHYPGQGPAGSQRAGMPASAHGSRLPGVCGAVPTALQAANRGNGFDRGVSLHSTCRTRLSARL